MHHSWIFYDDVAYVMHRGPIVFVQHFLKGCMQLTFLMARKYVDSLEPTVISLNDICSPTSSVRKVTTAIVPSQLQAISCFPVESHDKSRIESSNKSCITTKGRLNEVSHTDNDLSRLPSAQQGAPRPVSVSADSDFWFHNVYSLNLNKKLS